MFVCGVEGAGHHAMETVWDELSNHAEIAITTYNPGLHSFAKNETVDRAYQYSSIELSRHERRFKTFMKAPNVVGRKIIFDTRNSYPEGFGVGNLAHPDLVYLSNLDGKLFDLRVLVMYRDPTAAVLSAVRRFKVQEFQYKNYQFQARAVAESLTTINNGLAAVPCGKSMLLPYEDLLRDPSKYAHDLSKLVGVSHQTIKKCIGELHPPKPKGMEGDMAQMERDLKGFFTRQKHLWPLLTGSQKLPPLKVLPALQATGIGAGINSVQKSLVPAQRYLRITWHTNLGFNNMRFILESAMYLSQILGRRLMVAPKLRMRKCTDRSACEKTKCVEEDAGKDGKEYWCPIHDFISWGPLKAAGALIVQNEDSFLKSKKIRTIKGAFPRMFSDKTLTLDHVPTSIKSKLNATNQYPAGQPKNQFTYWRFHLGCELSYFEVKKQTWDSRRKKDAPLQIISVVDEYGKFDDTVLHLDGTPHNIGLTPSFWLSRDSLEESRAIWDASVVYHPAIGKFATAVQDALLKGKALNTYTCVHLRRGDFVSAGWLGKASDLDLVKKTVEEHRLNGEPVYMSTDEADPDVLAGFRNLGYRTWDDFKSIRHEGQHAPYLGFEDYVGLVEQTICGRARAFIGSKCSSFTGGILNLRRKGLGDNIFYTTEGKERKNGK